MSFFLAAMLSSAPIAASAAPAEPALEHDAQSLIAAAQARGLAGSRTWLKLLRYKDPAPFLDGVRSDIVSDHFFLAADGADDPEAELAASVRALLAPADGAPDTHAQCRFPARFSFLKAELDWPTDAPAADCPRLDGWRREGAVTGASLIFASGYLSNPSSFYGHLLLKFNSADGPLTHDLLDTSLNYGATYPENENPVLYIVKGLTGGYRSTFSHLQYYNHTHNYAESQLRDVWEYELNLSQDDVDLIVAHSWELMGATNRYYFLKQNCAYRMAELVDLVLDRSLIPPDKQWVMPIDVFERLSVAEHDGGPLLRAARRLPSRQNRFRESYAALSGAERGRVREALTGAPAPLETRLDGLAPERQIPVIDTLIDYYTFVEGRAEGPAAEAATAGKRDALIARLARPPGGASDPESPPPPHQGQRSSLAQVAGVSNARLGEGAELRLRAAYYDLLSTPIGVLPQSELTIGDLRLLVRDGALSVRAVEAIRVTTLNAGATGLPHDGGLAWRLRLGAEARDLSCDSCLVGYAEGGYGKGLTFPGGTIGYGFLNARAIAGDTDDGHFEAGPAFGVLFGEGRWFRANLEAGLWQGLDGDADSRPYAKAEARLGPGVRWDVRVGFEHQDVEGDSVGEARVALSRYW